ncbi:MAG: hypothetical protein E6H05_12800 [Bacillati bacterium ANGP1]|uniref:SD-repeat containing protein B domain-containing protein n=1 Tax=Candidatus Segetimicrobium genomatis TaxID=2569760 RepID=A0A537IIY3_9BACT|nr:MAG: hypothetical protein E6H05_12800 [Terrabacteria group bacterium ANGP1]
MRAFTVLLALVATPFLAGVSQQVKTNSGVGHDAAHCAMRAALRPGTAINKCDPAPTQPPVVNPPVVTPPGGDPQPPLPPPPPPSPTGCVNSGPAGGTASIDGQVFVDASPWPGLQDWCVQLSGPVSATAVTDASGNYLFSGLPAGTYTVCETVQTGWHETFPTSGPTCATGFGWTITVTDGSGASFIWFGNLTP